MTATGASSLAGALVDLGQLAARFADLLREEQASLRRRDAAGMEAAVRRKLEALQGIEAGVARLRQRLCELGVTPDRAGLQRSLTTAETRSAWRELRKAAIDCLRLNRANGLLIDAGATFATTVLAILRGSPVPADLYDREGRVDRTQAGRSIASA